MPQRQLRPPQPNPVAPHANTSFLPRLSCVGRNDDVAPALHAELTGTWSGVLEVTGTKLRVVLKFEGATAKLGSPDQTADEFPADEVTVEGDSVRVVVRKLQAE